jgi:acyl-CoA carboxylase epsilon subunit
VTETPYLRVVRGEPTAEELAALVAVLAARSAAPAPAPRLRSAWADPARRLGLTHRAGPGAWRRSALPA